MATRLVENYVGRLLAEDIDPTWGPGGPRWNPRITPLDPDSGAPNPDGWPQQFHPDWGPQLFPKPGENLDDRYNTDPDEDDLPEREPPITPNLRPVRNLEPLSPGLGPGDLPIKPRAPFGMQDPREWLRDNMPDFTDPNLPSPLGVPIPIPFFPRTVPFPPPVIG